MTCHVFHAYRNFAVEIIGTEETDDIRRVTVVEDLQLAHDLIPHGRLDLQMNQLYTYTHREMTDH